MSGIQTGLIILLGMCGQTAGGDPTTADLLVRAMAAIDESKSDEAVRLLTKVINADPKLATAYYLRGRERFRLAQFKESLADFDRFVELQPDAKSRQWERGIACFYAGEFQKGADQFALYQTYHDSDVENSVWRFLCMAPLVGVDKAREQLLPIKDDRRIPMMAIYEMYRGRTTPQGVLAACAEGDPSADQRASRRFYAELYIGLYYEALGDVKQAREFILRSSDDHRETKGINRYMWDVARIHAERLRAGERP